MNLGIIISILAAVVNLFFGFVAYFNNPKNKKNQIVAMLAIITSIWIVINGLSVIFIDRQTNLFLVRLSIFLAVPQIVSVFLLAYTIPKDKIRISKKYLYAVLVTGFFVMTLSVSSFIFSDINVSNGTITAVPGRGIIVFVAYVLGVSAAAIYGFYTNMINSEGNERQQVKYVMLGILAMIFLIIFTVMIPVSFFNYSKPVQFTPLYTLIFIGMATYAVIRHRFLDVRLLVARTISYSAIVLIVVAAYVVILFAIANLIPGVEINIKLIVALSVAGVILFFSAEPLQKFIKRLTDNVFFRAGYNTEELLSEITKVMASNIELHSLSDRIVDLLMKNVKLSKAAFVLTKDHQISNIYSKGYDQEEIKNQKWIEELLHSDEQNFIFEELQDEKLKEKFREFDTAIVMSLKVKDQEIGVFLIGPKASGELYSSQDLELFEILAPQLAIALQNAESYAEIQKFSVTLEKKVEERTQELRKLQESELAKAREIIRLKDEFVFIATHDLRTPATAIKGFVSLIKETAGDLPQTVAEDIEAIEQASDRLMQLVDDLLEVARSESGTIKIEVEETDAKEIIDSVLQEIKPSADERNIKIETDLTPNSNVMADPEKLQEIIENLLSNAVKYNKEGGSIEIKTNLEDDMLHFSVSDTGLGIPTDLHDKVFSKFFRARQEGTEEVPGTGLGLFVVRMLVEKMKGNIDFESKEGEGTTFKFSLPIAK